MSDTGAWVLGGVMALLAIVGLFLAANARDEVFYLTGLLLFLFGVLFDFALIGRHAGRQKH